MSNDTKDVVKEQKEIRAKAESYEALRTTANEELIEEETNLNSQKAGLGYGEISWQQLTDIVIEDLDQAKALQVLELRSSYTIYLQSKQYFDNTIYVEPSKLHEVVDAAEKLLLNHQDHIYQRSGVLVCVTTVENSPRINKQLINRAPDTMVIKEIDQAYLTVKLTEFGHFISFDTRSGYKKTDCPERIARYLLSKHKFNVPVLIGIINAPTLRKDGSILDEPGYDPESGLLFFAGDCKFEKVQENPTKQDAINALGEFNKILDSFPFEDDASKSVALAAILTALIRKSLFAAPLFAFSAPKMSSGKSLLADVVAMIATGKSNSVIAQADNETEEKKRILSVLMEGDQIICFDNIEKPFRSAALCSILTQDTYKDRLLGGNTTRTVPTNATFLVTGNNLVFAGDISSRALQCTLDPKVERPEERSFSLILREYIPQNRAKLVNAALTILRAYHVAGRLSQNLTEYGRFEEWSNWVRSAIVWIGMTDPNKTRTEIEQADPIRMMLCRIFTSWYELFGDRPIKVKELVAPIIIPSDGFAESAEKYEHSISLQEALYELAPDSKNKINIYSLGRQLSAYKKRIESGFRLEQCGSKQGTTLWRVVKIKE